VTCRTAERLPLKTAPHDSGSLLGLAIFQPRQTKEPTMGITQDRMMQDLELGDYAESTRSQYLAIARAYVAFFWRPAEELGADEVRQFIGYYLKVRKVGPGRLKQVLAALRFLYAKTLGRPQAVSFICWPKQPQRLPVVLGMTEVRALLRALREPKYRVLACLLYATGMRVSEVCRTQTKDIDAAQGVIRIRGKGRKERLVMMSPRLLAILRAYWRLVRPNAPYLFTTDGKPLQPPAVRKALAKATAPTCARSRCCWGTAAFARRASTRGCRPSGSPRPAALWTGCWKRAERPWRASRARGAYDSRWLTSCGGTAPSSNRSSSSQALKSEC
jgi:integrase